MLLTSLICVLLLSPKLQAAQEFVYRNSLSDQFAVYGPKASPIRHFQSDLVPLDSALVAVSCERIKRALLGQLEGLERWDAKFRGQKEGKIFAVLHSRSDQPVLITPIPTAGPLNYRIDLPNRIEATRFIDAVTETILLEMANRHSADKFAQIPRWLSQGLAAQVQAIAPETLVLEQHRPVTRVNVHVDPVAEIRRGHTNFSALMFEELSWPEVLPPEKTARYRRNAQIFVAELLRLNDGRDCLRRMLDSLPNYSRWQIAFMQSFEPHFKKFVDVEKWWGLTVVNLTGGDTGRILSEEQSIEQIDAALLVPVQVFHDFTATPKRNNLKLQEIVSQWELSRQKPALEKTVSQLRVLRSRVSPESASMLDDYCAALENYLQNEERNFLSRIFTRGNVRDLRQATCHRLDLLDGQREKIRNRPRPKPGTREEAILSALEATGQRKQ